MHKKKWVRSAHKKREDCVKGEYQSTLHISWLQFSDESHVWLKQFVGSLCVHISVPLYFGNMTDHIVFFLVGTMLYLKIVYALSFPNCPCLTINWCKWGYVLWEHASQFTPLQRRHNGRDSVSNRQSRDCFLNCLFRRRSKKTSKLSVTGLCAGNSPGTGEFPAQMASNAENVPFDDVIMQVLFSIVLEKL